MKRKNQSSSTNKFLKKRQFGGSTYLEKPIPFKPLSQKQIDSKFDGNPENDRWIADSYANDNYPELNYITDKFSGNRSWYHPLTGGMHISTTDGSPYHENVISELAHVKQNRKMSDLGMGIRTGMDKFKKGDRYEIPGTIEYEAHTEIEPIIEKDFRDYYLNLMDSQGRSDFLKKRLSRKQYGGTSQDILAEDGELFLDENGELQEVRGFSHDDSFVELPNGQTMISRKGSGGQILDDATSVLSDSYTQVKEGDRKNTEKEQQVLIKSKEAKELFDYKWFNAGKNKKYSPSELVKEVLKQRDKKLTQYSDAQKQDALSLSTNQLNASLMPSDEDIYNTVLGEQEDSKGSEFNDNMIAKDGIHIKPENKGKFTRFANSKGMGVQEAARHILANKGDYSTSRIKQANFARNASKFKHQYGSDEIIPINPNGLYEENGPVIVPTNGTGSITMEDINYPVEAYNADTGEYIDTMQPNENYQFNADNILEIPMKAQFGNDGTYFPPKYRVKSGDSLSKIANDYGLTLEQLLESNPNIANSNRINIGDEIIIPDVTIKGRNNIPVDRMSEIEGIEELPEELNVQAEEVIPTLDVKAENVSPVNSSSVLQEAKKAVDKIKLGQIDRTQGTNALREMMRANRSINLPYRAETPRRLYEYLEEDVTPYLDELDSQSIQALQNVNQNTAQGQAIAANILNRVGMNKRQIINRANSMNLQRRQQTDNANVQLQNQFDLMQEQNNKNYVDETYQTLANYDRNRVQQAEYLDDMINQNTRTKNFFTMENMRNPNYQIDPVTGEVFRIGTPLKQSQEKKAQFGIKRKKNKMC